MPHTAIPRRDDAMKCHPREPQPAHFVRQLCYQPAVVLDEALAMEIRQALHGTGYPALRDIEVEIVTGVVVLWGRVSSYYQKQLAQSVAQRVAASCRVANGLDVTCSR